MAKTVRLALSDYKKWRDEYPRLKGDLWRVVVNPFLSGSCKDRQAAAQKHNTMICIDLYSRL
jgi:hypothetical protein